MTTSLGTLSSLAFHAGDALKRAQYFLRLAEQATTEEDRCSLAGAAVILAIAYFSQGVEFRLVQAFANAAAEGGRRPSEAEIQRQLPGGLLARMRLLATVLGDAELRLDEMRPSTIRLISAIRLRNRLVHEAGDHMMGSPVESRLLDCRKRADPSDINTRRSVGESESRNGSVCRRRIKSIFRGPGAYGPQRNAQEINVLPTRSTSEPIIQ